eukprot:2276971-Prymnesium_polylepis.1
MFSAAFPIGALTSAVANAIELKIDALKLFEVRHMSGGTRHMSGGTRHMSGDHRVARRCAARAMSARRTLAPGRRSSCAS